MQLRALLDRLDVLSLVGDPDRAVHAVTRDSREVGPGVVFVAIRGGRIDGHDLVGGLDRAAAVVVEREVEAPPGVPVVRVADSKRALPALAAAVHGDPGAALRVVGITGTNGKTTTATLIEGTLTALGERAGRIGTTGTAIAGEPVESALTTPESTELQALLARMRDAGCVACAMEVSSIGLAQHRVDGIPYHLAVFTNLSRDHLDFHGDMEAYARAKSRLFRELLRPPGGPPRALLCGDDPAWTAMEPPDDRWLYGFAAEADIRIVAMDATPSGTRLVLDTPWGRGELNSPLLGRHNALNLAAAVGAGLALGLPLERWLGALGTVPGVPGRLEPVPNDRGILCLVDYAHTEDALTAAIAAVREVTRGRLTVVFGCGGDRDPGKRPRMGGVVERGADRVVVTSDNPRTEDPLRIIDAVLSGMDSPPAHVAVERAEAIRWAIREARPGDTVLIAGKGHESYQEIGGTRHPFDDRRVARDALEAG